MRQPPHHRVARGTFTATTATPAIGFDDSAREYRTIWVQPLPDDFQTELVKPTERGQVRAGEGSVRHVEVFRMAGVGTSILGRPRPLPASHAPTSTTPSTAMSPLRCPSLWRGGPKPSASRGERFISRDLPWCGLTSPRHPAGQPWNGAGETRSATSKDSCRHRQLRTWRREHGAPTWRAGPSRNWCAHRLSLWARAPVGSGDARRPWPP